MAHVRSWAERGAAARAAHADLTPCHHRTLVPRPSDVVVDKPKILFVGINPSLTSGKVGHHFAGPANPFWQLLHEAGFTPRPFAAAEDHELASLGYALVNLCPRPTNMASELTKGELEAGRRRLATKVRAMQPAIVALVGVTLYPLVFAKRRGKHTKGTPRKELAPGPGLKQERYADARVFVLPNPSGLNISFPTFAAKLPWYQQLRELELETSGPSLEP
jgi:TDG/mug DNA glycosylase family protein